MTAFFVACTMVYDHTLIIAVARNMHVCFIVLKEIARLIIAVCHGTVLEPMRHTVQDLLMNVLNASF